MNNILYFLCFKNVISSFFYLKVLIKFLYIFKILEIHLLGYVYKKNMLHCSIMLIISNVIM